MKPSPLPPRNLKLNPHAAANVKSTVPRRFPRKTVKYNGVVFRVYSLAWLSHLCGKSQRAFHKWERLGIFPRPLFDLKDGYRWYSAAEIHGYRRLVRSAGLRSGRYSDGEKRTNWLKRNAFDFKLKLQDVLKHRLGEVPTALVDEEEIMSALKKSDKLRITESDVLKMIKP